MEISRQVLDSAQPALPRDSSPPEFDPAEVNSSADVTIPANASDLGTHRSRVPVRSMIAASVTSVAFAASLTVPWVTAKDPFARPASSSVKDWTDQAAPDPRETSWQEASWEEASTIAVEELLRMEQKRSALAEREADYYRALAYDNEDWTA